MPSGREKHHSRFAALVAALLLSSFVAPNAWADSEVVHGVNLGVTLAFASGKDCNSKLANLKAQANWISTSATESDSVSDVGDYCHKLYPLGENQKLDLRSMFTVSYDFENHDECVRKMTAIKQDAIAVQEVSAENALQDIGEAGAYCDGVFPKPATQISKDPIAVDPGPGSNPEQGGSPRSNVGGAGPEACHGTWGVANPNCDMSW